MAFPNPRDGEVWTLLHEWTGDDGTEHRQVEIVEIIRCFNNGVRVAPLVPVGCSGGTHYEREMAMNEGQEGYVLETTVPTAQIPRFMDRIPAEKIENGSQLHRWKLVNGDQPTEKETAEASSSNPRPKEGEVWTLLHKWADDDGTEHQQMDMVEIVGGFDDDDGIRVAPLIPVAVDSDDGTYYEREMVEDEGFEGFELQSPDDRSGTGDQEVYGSNTGGED